MAGKLMAGGDEEPVTENLFGSLVMKKIRVYELAKEAGLENKVLVARLQEEGYEVKSHSSTLEEGEARDIRIKLGLVQTETKEKRIQEEGRTTIIRRRKTVVAAEPEPA
ncbi:translation initiation factor IF-2 N-terminal domain-containing protein, partial [Desulfurivibrio sp. C05AmB]|uniref:translation initiation factor IF-2 N-terminal domain-containing protein n=1 Tax=Desulfurivibrio sp. C05AmB TaxID=3374371 RepID=UPI00376F3831